MNTTASQSFDPYHRWLGIAPRDQPPNYYRLLSVDVFESDLDVIEMAADRQMSHLHAQEASEHADDAARLLSEVSRARLCLLNAKSKAAYDAELQSKYISDDAAKTRPTIEPQLSRTPVPSPTPTNPSATRVSALRRTPGDGLSAKDVQSRPPGIAPGALKPSDKINEKEQTDRSWFARTVLLVAVGVVGLVLLLAAGLVIRVATDTGELLIESHEPSIRVLVKKGDKEVKTIETEVSQQSVKVRSGNYQIELVGTKADKFEVDKRQITLNRGDKVVVKITRRNELAAQDQKTTSSSPKTATNVPRPSTPPATRTDSPTGPAAGKLRAEVGAVVEVARMTIVPFAHTDKLPGSPSTAFVATWINRPKSADINNGVLQFDVKEEGVVYLVTHTAYEGNRSGGWWEKRVTKGQLVNQGWTDLGRCPWRLKETLLKRTVKPGESYRIRTNKYGPPQLIVPGPLAD